MLSSGYRAEIQLTMLSNSGTAKRGYNSVTGTEPGNDEGVATSRVRSFRSIYRSKDGKLLKVKPETN